MPTGSGDFQYPFRLGLALDFRKIDVIVRQVRCRRRYLGRFQGLFTSQMASDIAKCFNAIDRKVRTEQGFRCIVPADEDGLHPLSCPFQYHRQDTVDRAEPPIQGQFAHEETAFASFSSYLATRYKDGYGQAQVEAGCIFLEVCRCQINRQASHGEFITTVLDGCPDPFFGFFHRRSCQAH